MKRASGWLLALMLAASSVAVAQETCNPTESFTACFNRIYEAQSKAAGPAAKADNESEQKKELAKAQTGADSGGAATASTLTDLVPLFDALGLVSNQNDDGTLTFNLNFLTPTQDNADKNTQVKLTVNPSPEPLTQLVEAFPETVRGARKDELQKRIRVIGDAQLAVSYSLVNQRFGRDYRRHRDELVGPEKTSATVTLELTKANIGSFFRGAGALCKDPDVALGKSAYDKCVDRLRDYLGDEGSNLETQGRLKISASYQRVDSVTYAYPADNLLLNLPKTDRIEASVAYGFPLSAEKNADRIDFEATYDSNINNDTSNKERLKAAVTYTRHVGDMDVPFSVVYANKSEFLGDVDHQVSMHLGVKFKPPAK